MLVTSFEKEKDLTLPSCLDYMNGWIHSNPTEEEFTLLQPSLDEL